MSNIYIIIFILVALIAIFAVVFILRNPKKKRDSSIDYTAALNYLLSGERRKAFEKLKETVRKNTTNIDAYIKLADILRDEGHVQRAIKVHRSLTVRNNLTQLERIQIAKSLVKDYKAAERYDKAIETCQSLMDLTNGETWVQELLIRMYEEKGDWEKAFEAQKKFARKQGVNKDWLLALYKVEEGLRLIEKEKEHDGRVKFREAIKIDKKCAPAYLYLSDSYIRKNRLSDAFKELKRFLKKAPQLSYLAFGRIKEVLYETGDFGDIENIYNDLFQHNPDIHSIRFALADLYERKGEIEHAIELCREELEKHPDSELAKQYLVKYYARTGNSEKAVELSLELVEKSLNEEMQFTCENCGFTDNRPYWHCPQCHAWNSYLN
ncbi:tetratricopeptide repeat protein [candidate division KSB1 bacterium]|nr:tetratricopeptide repeat protein [candidate division KSB1 bacterium]